LKKFQNIDPALPRLAFGEKGVRPADLGRYFPLSQSRFTPRLNETLYDGIVDSL
jgi:hypothetical protein